MSKSITEVLSLEAVKAAYQKTGLKPIHGFYRTVGQDAPPGCACPAGAVACFVDPVLQKAKHEWGANTVAATLGLGVNDVMAFASGFDAKGDGSQWGGGKKAWMHGRTVATELGL